MNLWGVGCMGGGVGVHRNPSPWRESKITVNSSIFQWSSSSLCFCHIHTLAACKQPRLWCFLCVQYECSDQARLKVVLSPHSPFLLLCWLTKSFPCNHWRERILLRSWKSYKVFPVYSKPHVTCLNPPCTALVTFTFPQANYILHYISVCTVHPVTQQNPLN